MAELSLFSDLSLTLFANAEPSAPQPLQKMLYDRKSAAYVLSISTRALDYLIAGKQLKTLRLGRKVMIGHGELIRFSRANHQILTDQHASVTVD